MELLKGKQVMVWTFMGNARMYEALRDYGDRISQIGLFSFKVRATGEIYESGVAISNMLTYINKWPHIKWLLTVANDGSKQYPYRRRDVRACVYQVHVRLELYLLGYGNSKSGGKEDLRGGGGAVCHAVQAVRLKPYRRWGNHQPQGRT